MKNPEFQFSTFKPLAGSKKYFESRDQIRDHLSDCVKMTNQHLLKSGRRALSHDEISEGCRLLRLDHEKCDNLMGLLGQEKDLDVSNLIRKGIDDQEEG